MNELPNKCCDDNGILRKAAVEQLGVRPEGYRWVLDAMNAVWDRGVFIDDIKLLSDQVHLIEGEKYIYYDRPEVILAYAFSVDRDEPERCLVMDIQTSEWWYLLLKGGDKHTVSYFCSRQK